MNGTHAFYVCALLALGVLHSAAAEQPRLSGGGPISTSSQSEQQVSCFSGIDRKNIAAGTKAFIQQFGPLSTPTKIVTATAAAATSLYTFYPQAGTLFGDLFIVNYNDLDGSSGVLSYDCGEWSYNGHDATDVALRSFAEQAIGVPIYAALDGVVISTNDGEFDMNFTNPDVAANFVRMDHGNGRVADYWHMKNGSVAVSPGEFVKAGQQIGLTGSSGRSTGPHIHFASRDNGVDFEPFAGACRGGASGWTNQNAHNSNTYLWDGAASFDNIAGIVPPFAFPHSGQIATTDPFVYTWVFGGNMPIGSTMRHQLRRPNGTIATDSGTFNINNTEHFRTWWWWFGHDTTSTGISTTTGTWHVLWDVNGVRVGELPFEVLLIHADFNNSPPEPITVTMEPVSPTVDDVVTCRIGTDLVLDDPDYDVLEYNYVWTINGNEVRNVVTAAHSDVIPHHTGFLGDTVRCEVTASDGIVSGTTVSASAVFPGTCAPPTTPGTDSIVAGIAKNRYFSVLGTSATNTALRVTITGAPAGMSSAIGNQYWVGPPRAMSESGGSNGDSPSPTFLTANLQCRPQCENWGSLGMVHVGDVNIVPGVTYEIEAVDCGCNMADEGMYSTSLPLTAANWADVFPPNPTVDFLDIQELVKKFKSVPGAIIKARADIAPAAPDGLVDFIDIQEGVKSFKGADFPYAIPTACP